MHDAVGSKAGYFDRFGGLPGGEDRPRARREQLACEALIRQRNQHLEESPDDYPELDLLYHIGNGGKRTTGSGKVMKRMGVKKGMPDYHLPVGRGGYLSLYIEMKDSANGRVLPHQKAVHESLLSLGNQVLICFGCEEAWAALLRYLDLPPTVSLPGESE